MTKSLLTITTLFGFFLGAMSMEGIVAPVQALHGPIGQNDVFYIGYKSEDNQYFPSCHHWLDRGKWYSNNTRNYRWGGGLNMCAADPSAIWRQLGIRNVNNDWPDMSVSTWHDIRLWNHSNVVAVSRCRWDVPGGHIPDNKIACMYHRY